MILAINSGSSSIKFSLYEQGNTLAKIFFGEISRIGSSDIAFTFGSATTQRKHNLFITVTDYPSAIGALLDWIEKRVDVTRLAAIGHRIVHGMKLSQTSLVTEEILNHLKETAPYDPDHLPYEIKLIEAFGKMYPTVLQFVCFDTAFHHDMPRKATLLPIPRRFDALGVHRYGFHGLSFQYLMVELEKSNGKSAANGRIILAHLGSGASIAAVYQGKSIDTSMGFTPASGLPMSTRSGDLDPGTAWFMMKHERLSPDQFNHLVNHEAGLLGISETSGDMQQLLKQESADVRSAEAIEFFCYYVKKQIGAYAAALGGLDRLIFSGGIGENSPVIRARICEGLGFLGIELDETLNKKNTTVISTDATRVVTQVIPTDEELMIATIVNKFVADIVIEN
ncbi:acetate/propionate family kinase [soil metagenome]